MATWKKVIVSGSRAHLTDVTASGFLSTAAANNIGFFGTASWAVSASYAANVSAPVFNISGSTGVASFAANADLLLLTGSNGLGVTVTDNGAITTASFGIPTNAQVTFGGVTSSLFGTASWADNTTNSNKILTAQDGTAATRYLTFVDSDNASPTYESLYTDAGISYNPSTNDLTISGDLGVNGGDITTSATTATVFNTNATTVNAFGAATTLTIGNNGTNAAITIGSATSTASFGGNVVIAGGLDVNGTVTTIDTQNLLVADQYILLGSGSATNKPGGIIIQSSPTPGSGFAFAYDSTTDRWLMQDSGSSTSGLNAVSLTTTMATVAAQNGISSARPSDANGPIYGGATNGYGNMWIDTDGDRDIWIYV